MHSILSSLWVVTGVFVIIPALSMFHDKDLMKVVADITWLLTSGVGTMYLISYMIKDEDASRYILTRLSSYSDTFLLKYRNRKCFWTTRSFKIENTRVPENLDCKSSVQITVQRKVDVYVVDLEDIDARKEQIEHAD